MMNNLTDVTVDKRRRETDVSTLVGYHHAVSNAAVATTSRTFAGVDVFAATVLATVVFQVGKLGIAPIAFQTLLPLVAAVFFPRITARGLSLCSTNWAFYIFCAISLIDSLFGNTAATFVLRYGVLGTVGRTISQLCLLLFFVGYTASKDGRVARVLRWVTILAVISELWFVAEVRLGSPFTDWRGRFYHDTYLLESFKTNRSIEAVARGYRTGLAPYLHVFGYTACVGAAAGLCSVLLKSQVSRPKIPAFNLIALSLGFVSLAMSLQRSALLGAISAGLFCLRSGQARKQAIALLAGTCVAVGVAYLSVNYVRNTSQFETMGEKLQSASDVRFRLQMQFEAVRLILSHPFGLKLEGTDWVEEGMNAAAAKADVTVDRAVAVHNAYLVYGLDYGWVGLALVLAFLYYTGRMILFLSSPTLSGRQDSNTSVAVAAISFGLIFVQSMFHHASVLSREPMSIVFFSLLITLYASEQNIKLQRRNSYPARD